MPTGVRAASCLAVLAVTLVVWASIGCAPRSEPLAEVGRTTLTRQEFEDVAKRVAGQYPPLPADSAKHLLYQDLLRRALLIEYATRSGALIDSLVDDYRDNVESEVLHNALMERMAPRVPVSEGEARTLYGWRDSVTKLQLIYAPDRRTADAAMAAIRSGQDFTLVASRVNLAGLLPPGGILDYLPPGSLVNPLDDILRTGRLSQIYGPVQAPGEGWFIVRPLARRYQPHEPWEQEQAPLAQMLQQRKRRLLMVRAFETLRDGYRVKPDPAGVYAFFGTQNRPDGQGSAPPDLVLARYDGADGRTATYRLGDALVDLDQDPRNRPNPTMLPSYTQWIESRVVRRVAVIEARRRHIDEEPEIASQIRQRVDNYVLEGIYELAVVPRAEAGPHELEAAYQRRSAAFVRLHSARLQFVVIPDSAGAARVIELARRAPTLREAILHSSTGMPVREEEVAFPNAPPPWGGMDVTLRAMSAGSYGDPIPVGGGWMAYQLISKQQSVDPFESLPPQVQDALHTEAVEMARERRLTALTDSLRRVLPVREYPERLERIPWPEGDGGTIRFPG